ncbi:hypothetical protein N8D56_09295 [Devosia sp. A8/3-2]|nr:hypothetical protein N8D56_09295 [Devosia sp. A8/3-2]
MGGSSVSIEPAKDEPEAPKPDVRPIPSIVARAEASKSGPSSPLPGASNVRPLEAPLKGPSFEVRREPLPFAANSTSEALRGRAEPSAGNRAPARQQVIVPLEVVRPATDDSAEVETALSSVREVEVEPATSDPREAESAMATAIEVLDREARGESSPALPEREKTTAAERGAFAMAPAETAETTDDAGFAAARPEAALRRGADDLSRGVCHPARRRRRRGLLGVA